MRFLREAQRCCCCCTTCEEAHLRGALACRPVNLPVLRGDQGAPGVHLQRVREADLAPAQRHRGFHWVVSCCARCWRRARVRQDVREQKSMRRGRGECYCWCGASAEMVPTLLLARTRVFASPGCPPKRAFGRGKVVMKKVPSPRPKDLPVRDAPVRRSCGAHGAPDGHRRRAKPALAQGLPLQKSRRRDGCSTSSSRRCSCWDRQRRKRVQPRINRCWCCCTLPAAAAAAGVLGPRRARQGARGQGLAVRQAKGGLAHADESGECSCALQGARRCRCSPLLRPHHGQGCRAHGEEATAPAATNPPA